MAAARATLDDILDETKPGQASLNDIDETPPAVKQALSSVPRPKAPVSELSPIAEHPADPFSEETVKPPQADSPAASGKIPSWRKALPRASELAAGAVEAATDPSFSVGGETGVHRLGPEVVQAGRELTTPGQRSTGALRLAEAGTEALTPFMGPAALENPVALARGIAEGTVASKGTGYLADKTGATPEQKELAEQLAFWAPGVARSILQPNVSIASSPEAKAATVSMRGAGAGVAVTPEEVVLGGRFGSRSGQVRIPRNGGPPAAPQIEPPTIEGNQPPVAANPVDEAAAAMAAHQNEEAQAMRMASGLPPVPPPPPQAPPPPVHELSAQDVRKIGGIIAQMPDEMRPQAMLEAHGTLSRLILQQGKMVGPDGKIVVVTKPEQAEKLATDWINDEVDRQDELKEQASKESARVSGEGARSAGAAESQTLSAPASLVEQVKRSRAANVAAPVESAHIDQIQEEPAQTAKLEDIKAPAETTALKKPAVSGEVLAPTEKIPPTDLDRIKEEIRNQYPGNSEAQVEKAAREQHEFEQTQKRGAAIQPNAPRYQKGDQVTLSDGTPATISYSAPHMRIVRATTQDGKKVTLTGQAVSDLKKAEQKKYKYGNTQAHIPDESEAAKAIDAARQRIPASDLAGQGKDIGGNHVTVRYGIKGDDTEGIKRYLEQQEPFDATLGKTEKFEPSESSDGATVIKAPVEAADLKRMNAELEKHGEFIPPTFKEYKPHATVAYVKPEVADRYVGMDVTHGKKFRVDSVAISKKDGTQEVVKLGGKKSPEAEHPNLVLGEHAAHTEMVETPELAKYGRDTEMVPVDELAKFKEFDRRATPDTTRYEGQEGIDELKEDVKKNGIREPLVLKYGSQDRKAHLWDGNHRLAAAQELGIKELPVRVKTAAVTDGKFGVSVPGHKGENVPEALKPSDIGIPARAIGEKKEAKVQTKISPEAELREASNDTLERRLGQIKAALEAAGTRASKGTEALQRERNGILIEQERRLRADVAKEGFEEPAEKPAPKELAGQTPNIEKFKIAYRRHLERAIDLSPEQFAYSKDKIPEVVDRITEGLRKGGANKDSIAIRAALKELKIKDTYAAIREYLNKPGPEQKPQLSAHDEGMKALAGKWAEDDRAAAAAKEESKPRVAKLIDRFEQAMQKGDLPTDPRELREMAKQHVGGLPAAYVDDIYDGIEGASNRFIRPERLEPHDKNAISLSHEATLEERLKRAQAVEDQIGKRTRSLEITKLQQFSTPHTLSEAAAYALDAKKGEIVLEPTAGTGNLLEPLQGKQVGMLANELDPRRVEVLKANGYQVTQGDYIKTKYETKPDAIVTNPPWGKISSGRYDALNAPAPWGKYGDVSERFLVKNLNDLAPGGRVSAVMPTTILGSSGAGMRKWINQNHTLRALIQSPPGAYERRGTTVDSVLMVVDKGKIPDAPAPIVRVESEAPKDWAEYAAAVAPLAEGGSHARTSEGKPTAPIVAQERTSPGEREPAGQPSQVVTAGKEPAALGSESHAQPASGTAGTAGGNGLPELRQPGASAEPLRSEDAGLGADLVSQRAIQEPLDGPGADGASQPAAAPRLVRQSVGALRPRGVTRERENEFDEAERSPIFTPYVLRSGVSGNPHPRQIVETRSLAGASSPEISYKPAPPVESAHQRKSISDEQYDVIAAVGQASEHGHGYLAADDVGVGKSREIAGAALDWLEKGKAKRILITSKAEVNLRDLEREMKIVAGVDPDKGDLPFKLVYLRDFKDAGERANKKTEYSPIPAYDKAVYLVESHNLTPYARAISELHIDGLLADEAHTYKNEDAGLGMTWAGLHSDWLARKIPMAYFTATPATTLDELQYLYGLREWSPDGFADWVARKTGNADELSQRKRKETALPEDQLEQQVGTDATSVSRASRISELSKQLAAAQRMGDDDAARRLKGEIDKVRKQQKFGRKGSDVFHVKVSTAEMEQIMRELKMKGKYGARDLWRGGVEFSEHEVPLTKEESGAYRRAVQYMRDVEVAYNKYANENEGMRKSFGITAFLQAAAKRKLFDFRLTRAIDRAKEALSRGEQPVISVINVNPTEEGKGYLAAALDSINVKKILWDKDNQQMIDLGEIPEAVAAKNELLESAGANFPASPDPIEAIKQAFGKEKVAVITGQESPKVRRDMMEDFQKGIRQVAIISGAGKTGISLHHVLETKAGAKGRRHMILADYEWSATQFKQELGRVDRAGQLTPPKITALTLGSAAEKKFISTIANRMKTLGAVSKGAAESAGATALEHFELGGDIDNMVIRDMWRTLPEELKAWFRGRQFTDTMQDGTGVPKHTIHDVGVRDFLLQLQLIPTEEGNQIWDHFWKTREETYSGEKVAEAEARKTSKGKGEILRVHNLKPDLEMYEVRDASGHRSAILAGMVTEYMPLLQQFLDKGTEEVQPGLRLTRTQREYASFQGQNGEQISGLKVRPGLIEPIAKQFGKKVLVEHTPETALADVRSGDHVPLENGWSLRMGKGGEKKGFVIIEGAKLSNTERGQTILKHGAKYNPVSGGFFYLPEDDGIIKNFLERFPILKRLASEEKGELTIGKPEKEVPGPGAKNAGAGRETESSHLGDLTESLSGMNDTKSTVADRMRQGARLAESEDTMGDTVSHALDRVKGTAAAAWSVLRTPPEATDWERLTAKWTGAQNYAAWELEKFSKAIKSAVPNKLRREALSNWIEAGGDRELLKERAEKSDAQYKPGYQAALKLTDAEQTVARNIQNFHDAILAEAQKAGILDEGVENYVQHIWAKTPEAARKVMAQINFNSLRPNPAFAKERRIPTYFDGEQLGFKPLDKDVGFLTAAHDKAFQEAIASRAYIKSLFAGRGSDGRPLATISRASAVELEGNQDQGAAYLVRPKIMPQDKYADYGIVDHPALRKWKWADKTEDGRDVFVQGDALIHPEVYHRVKNNLSRSAFQTWTASIAGHEVVPGRLLLGVSSQLKQVILSLGGGFHQTTVAVHALEHKVPPIAVPDLDLDRPEQRFLVDHGLMVADFNAMQAFSEGVASGGLVNKIPVLGPLQDAYQQYLFKSYIPRLKMAMAKAALRRNLGRYRGQLSDDQIGLVTASQANAAFGGLNYKLLGRNPTFQDALRTVLLAPDFLEARGRFVGQAAKGYGREQLTALLLGAAVLYAGLRFLNQMLDGQPHYDKPFTLVYHGKEYALRTVQGDIYHLATDARGFLYGRLNPLLRTGIEAVTGRDEMGRERSAPAQIKDYLKENEPIPVQAFTRKANAPLAEKITESILRSIGVNVKTHRSAAEELAHKLAISHIPPRERTSEEEARYAERRHILEALRNGDHKPLNEARAKHQLNYQEAQHLLRRSRVSALADTVNNFTYQEVMQVKKAAEKDGNQEEVKELDRILRRKRMTMYERHERIPQEEATQ